MKELEKYLALHEGSRWTWEDSQYVLAHYTQIERAVIAHVAEVERTYRAMIEHEQGVRLRLRKSLDDAATGGSLLRAPSLVGPSGCHCKPGRCMAPTIQGQQMACLDPGKAMAKEEHRA